MSVAPDADVAAAAADYRWLLDRGYPDQGALKLVGDRYRLSRTGRAMLYRGVFSTTDSTRRAAKLVPFDTLEAGTLEADTLTIDGHNVLFTIWNALAGRPVVEATDWLVRDIGGTRSRLPHDERFDRVAGMLCRALASAGVPDITVLLDDPLPWSREQCTTLERIWAESAPAGGGRLVARTERSVDAAVAATASGLIATSDTAVVDRCPVRVVDLGGYVVTRLLERTPIVMEPQEQPPGAG